MSTKTVMDTILQHLRDANLVKNKNSVKLHAGKFTWAELKRRGFNSPALFISCLGWRDAKPDDETTLGGYDIALEARFAIGIVASDSKKPESRNLEARLLAEKVTLELLQQDWGLDNCLEATQRRAEGLFVPAAEKENSSLWLVTWYQVIGTSKEEMQNSIDDWLSYHAEHYDENDPEHLMAADTVEITTT
ncbi:MAG: hypothetical protein ACRBB4_01440 [Neptuniibacter sp.]